MFEFELNMTFIEKKYMSFILFGYKFILFKNVSFKNIFIFYF